MSHLTTRAPAPAKPPRRHRGISIVHLTLTWLLALAAFAVAASLP